jgi:aminoglycoside phosphotransferase (APT) family kinase protein
VSTPTPPELPGLPYTPVTDWLVAHLPQLVDGVTPDRPWTAELLAGGLSNLTYRLLLPAGSVVLRRPPLAAALPRAHDVAREHRVQSALRGSPVPVADMLGLCEDPGVIGVPFYLMSDVRGEVLRRAADTDRLDASTRDAVADVLVGTLVDLHAVGVADAGLTDFGRGADYSARQLRRWTQQWQASATRDLPEMTTLLQRLSVHVPVQREVCVVHGDYRLDNTVVGLGGATPTVEAVLDWELSTLGDPLADLGVFLTYWHESNVADGSAFPLVAGLCAQPGFPDVDELARRYAVRSSRDLDDLAFYRALASMKLAVILEGVHARFVSGRTVGPGYELAGPAVAGLVQRAHTLLD